MSPGCKEERAMTMLSNRCHRQLMLYLSLAVTGCSGSITPPADPTPEKVVRSRPATGQPATDDGKQPKPATGSAPPAVLPPAPPFDGWPEPTVALFFTGQQLGYIEPCGCTGLENQKGGLARRHTLLRQLQNDKGWAVVPLDVGSQVRRYGRQQEIKFQHTASALRTLGYKAVAFGADDLRLPAGELLSGTNTADDVPSIFTSANVALISRDLTPQFQVVEAGGKKIGVAAVLGDAFQRKLETGDLVHEPAIEGLKKGCTKLKEQNCDYYVLLAHAPLDETTTIAQEVPLFDLVVTSGGGGLPSTELEPIEGTKSKLLKISHKAMHAGVVGLYDNESTSRRPGETEPTIRYQSVTLDASFKDSPEMLQLLADYQEQLKGEGLAGLGLKPQPLAGGAKLVGSETCGECHTKAMAVWSKTPHAHATDSLVTPPNSRGNIPRHFDPECLSCHVTGWEPQKFFPFESGYLNLQETKHLKHNGCENCHGPGSAHLAAENGSDAALQAKLREAMKLPIAGGKAEAKCRECHDEDNSPDFSHRGFTAYWKEVEHVGKD
jgi:hypothetical protein